MTDYRQFQIINLSPQTTAAAAYAFAVSSSPLLVLFYGLWESPGNSYVTAGILILPSLVLATIGFTRGIDIDPTDVLFGAFMACLVGSYFVNPAPANLKAYGLMLTTAFLAYAAGRVIQFDDLKAVRMACFWTSAGVLLIGIPATMLELKVSWGLERPIVFGFDHAVNVFSLSLGYFVICCLFSIERFGKKLGAFSAITVAISSFVLACATVRFSLALTALALLLALASQARRAAIIFLPLFMLSVGAGVTAQHSLSSVLLGYLWELPKSDISQLPQGETDKQVHSSENGQEDKGPRQRIDTTPRYLVPPQDLSNEQRQMPSCTLKVNLRNSVVIREVLYMDAIALAPSVGLFGYGLGAFSELGCLRGYEVHNVLVQAIVELGWLGGGALIGLLLVSLWRAWKMSKTDSELQFLLFLCCFILLVDIAHGGLNRELPLFISIGALNGATSLKRKNSLKIS